MPIPKTLSAGFRALSSGRGTEGYPAEIKVARWARKHAEEVGIERQARAALRAGILEIIGVGEARLADGSRASKLVSAALILDKRGEFYPNIGFVATADKVSFNVHIDPPQTPYGWDLIPLRGNRPRRAYLGDCMDIVLGTELMPRVGFARDFWPDNSTSRAADRVSDAMEFMGSHPHIYDFDAAVTQLRLPQP